MNWQLTGSDGRYEIQGDHEYGTGTGRVALIWFATPRDARIMAAAEEMLQVLEVLVAEADEYADSVAFDMAREIIAKVGGEDHE